MCDLRVGRSVFEDHVLPLDFVTFFDGLVVHPKDEDGDDVGSDYNHFVFGDHPDGHTNPGELNEGWSNDDSLEAGYIYPVELVCREKCLKLGDQSRTKIKIDFSEWLLFGYFNLEEESEYYAINVNRFSKQYLAVAVFDEQSSHRYYSHYSKFISFVKSLTGQYYKSTSEGYFHSYAFPHL